MAPFHILVNYICFLQTKDLTALIYFSTPDSLDSQITVIACIAFIHLGLAKKLLCFLMNMNHAFFTST